MRELKFRVWDGEQMVSPDYIDRDGVAHWMRNCSPRCSKEVMQFTGLRDRYGKEIYEGDITLIRGEAGEVYTFVVKAGVARRDMASGWTVDIPSFYFESIKTGFQAFPIVKNYCGKHDLKLMSIIGNIKENTELLENAK